MDTGKAVVLVALIIGAVVLGIFFFNRCDGQTVGTSLPKLVAPAAAEEETETPAPPVCEKGKCKATKVVVAECCFNSDCGDGQVCINGQCKGPWKPKATTTVAPAVAPTTITVTKTMYACPPPDDKIVVDNLAKCPPPAPPKNKNLVGECKGVESGWLCATEL